VEFSPNPSTTNTGDDGGIAVGWLPGGSAFIVHKLDPDWSVASVFFPTSAWPRATRTTGWDGTTSRTPLSWA
jgi:hypothetical protein